MTVVFAAGAGRMGLGESLVYSLVGMAVVFLALIAINVMIKAMSALINRSKQAVASAPIPVEPAEADVPVGMMPAQGSLGEIDLHEVDDRTAAMIVAVVADELQTPLNQLRFRSIRVKHS